MGIASSRPRGPPTLLLTLDGLGTLFKLKAPVAQQYLSVARNCGLKFKINEDELSSAFKAQFKSMSQNFPNYGKKQLASPEVWWKQLVNHSFKAVSGNRELPPDLANATYQHFSSQAAYQLYPDVRPFFQMLKHIRSDRSNPQVYVGVVSNSDPRISNVMKSLGLKIGVRPAVNAEEAAQAGKKAAREGKDISDVYKLRNLYDESNDLDFVVTSYEAGHAKPHKEIFSSADFRAALLLWSEIVSQAMGPSMSAMQKSLSAFPRIRRFGDALSNMSYMHVGNDYEEDYRGALASEWQALYLVREGEGKYMKGAETVSSLTEVGLAIKMLVQEQKKNG